MQLNVLLLPLVGGFLFLWIFRRTAYFITQQSTATLSLWIVAAGVPLLIVARLAVMLCNNAEACSDAVAVSLLNFLLMPLLGLMVLGLVLHQLTDMVERQSHPEYRRPAWQLTLGTILLIFAIMMAWQMWSLIPAAKLASGRSPLWMWIAEFAALVVGSAIWAGKIRVRPASMVFRSALSGLFLLAITSSVIFYAHPLTASWLAFSYPTVRQIPSVELGTSAVATLLGPLLAITANLVYPRTAVELHLFRNRVNNSLERLLYRATRRKKMVMITLDDNKVYCGYVDWIPGSPGSTDAYLEILPVFSGYRDSDRRVALPTSYGPVLDQLGEAERGQFKKVVPVARILSAGEFDPNHFDAFAKTQSDRPISATLAPERAAPSDRGAVPRPAGNGAGPPKTGTDEESEAPTPQPV